MTRWSVEFVHLLSVVRHVFPRKWVEVLRNWPVGAHEASEYGYVVDLVYIKRPTALIRAAEARGVATVDGLEILVRQGARSFRIWTGIDPPIQAMRRGASDERGTDRR